MKVLFVCHGNICRSQLAEGILRCQLRQHGLDWQVDSAGVISWHQGEPPHPLSAAVARKHGVDISGQRSRPITAQDFEVFDYVLFMDSDNQRLLQKKFPEYGDWPKLRKLASFDPAQPDADVPDPYYGAEDDHEAVFWQLWRLCELLMAGVADSYRR